jgi:hypothetical protein
VGLLNFIEKDNSPRIFLQFLCQDTTLVIALPWKIQSGKAPNLGDGKRNTLPHILWVSLSNVTIRISLSINPSE